MADSAAYSHRDWWRNPGSIIPAGGWERWGAGGRLSSWEGDDGGSRPVAPHGVGGSCVTVLRDSASRFRYKG
jgi:hypothetical protein